MLPEISLALGSPLLESVGRPNIEENGVEFRMTAGSKEPDRIIASRGSKVELLLRLRNTGRSCAST